MTNQYHHTQKDNLRYKYTDLNHVDYKTKSETEILRRKKSKKLRHSPGKIIHLKKQLKRNSRSSALLPISLKRHHRHYIH